MNLDLTDEQTAALLKELDSLIAADRFPFSPRIQMLKAIRAKLRPEPVREPLPEPKQYAPQREDSDAGEIPAQPIDDPRRRGKAGVRLIVWCKAWQYQADPDPADQALWCGAETTVPDWRERLVCSKFGSGHIDMVVSGTKR
jgi:hypothetical protein